MITPLCRYCGKPIAKITKTIVFGSNTINHGGGGYMTYRQERPATREEAQRFTNEEIVSIRYLDHYEHGRYVSQISTWDAERYVSKFFCKDAHARDFGYAAANMEKFIAMPEYFKALQEQKEKANAKD